MDLLVFQVATAFICFFVFVIVGALPFCAITCSLRRGKSRNLSAVPLKSAEETGSPERGLTLISLANCFACGIFISACFIGLIPHVRHESLMLKAMVLSPHNDSGSTQPLSLDQFIDGYSSDSFGTKIYRLPDTEVLIVCGFVFIMVLEQVMGFCHLRGRSKKVRGRRGQREANGGWGNDLEFQPLVSPHLLSSEENEDTETTTRNVLKNKVHPLTSTSYLAEVGRAEDSASEDCTLKFQDEPPRFSRVNFPAEDEDVVFRYETDTDVETDEEEEAPKLSFQSVILLFGLGIHAVFEGLAIGLQITEDSFLRLLMAVLLHEVLVVLAFGLSLAKQKASLGYGMLSVVILSSAIPLGMLVGIPIPKTKSYSTVLLRYILEGFAGGIFVYVACVEMLAGELMGNGHGHSHGPPPPDSPAGRHSHAHPKDTHCLHSKACTNFVKALTVSAGVLSFIIVVLLVP